MLLLINILFNLFAGVHSTPHIGVLNTADLHSQSDPWRVNKDVVDMTCNPVQWIVQGIQGLRIHQGDAVLAHAYMDSTASGDGFVTTINSWSDTNIPWAQVGWFGMEHVDDVNHQFEFGEWNSGLYGNDWIPLDNEERMDFLTPFDVIPNVIVFVNGIAQLYGANYRFDTSAINIDKAGFTLNAHSWADTIFFGAGVSWIAYPSNKQSIASGSDSSWNYRDWQSPLPFNGRYISFPPGTFQAPPQVFIALHSFDFGMHHDFTIEVSADQITQDGFTWHADGSYIWPEGWPTIYGVGISWLAFA